ncbi:involucrin-like [Drosophila albomicans]|uniref:Involucrin-like n=1 Tax=Drosophila albomicans TaxID=7291 RepID=A0A6P8YYN6_DROAB|nr:involucrin-like [Drosophila albomicans]
MEDLKQAILNMMAEQLDDGLKQLEEAAANLRMDQPEGSQNQQLLDDPKPITEENKFELNQTNLNLHELHMLKKELDTQVAISRHQNTLIHDLKGQAELDLAKIYECQTKLVKMDDKCYKLERKLFKMQKKENLGEEELGDEELGEEELHFQIDKLQKELEAKDDICHQLEQQISQVYENPEYIEMRKQLLDHLKEQEELHLQEVNELRKELEAKDDICHKLEQDVAHVGENPEYIQMRQQLLDHLNEQEQLHLQEVNELRKELEAKDVICHKLEQNVAHVGENPEYIQMRQQLQDTIKCQEEVHLRDINEMRQELDLRDNICLQKEQKIEDLEERLELSTSCDICMETFNTSSHRLVALSCGHLFGESCVRECLRRNPLCPECRTHVSVNNMRYVFPRYL